MSQILFEDTIGISSLNDAGKKFERGTFAMTEKFDEEKLGTYLILIDIM